MLLWPFILFASQAWCTLAYRLWYLVKSKLMLVVAGQWMQPLWYEFATRLVLDLKGWLWLFCFSNCESYNSASKLSHCMEPRTGSYVLYRLRTCFTVFLWWTNAALDDIALLITTPEPPRVGLSPNLFVFVCPLFTLESYPLSESTEGMVSCCEERKGKDKKD